MPKERISRRAGSGSHLAARPPPAAVIAGEYIFLRRGRWTDAEKQASEATRATRTERAGEAGSE